MINRQRYGYFGNVHIAHDAASGNIKLIVVVLRCYQQRIPTIRISILDSRLQDFVVGNRSDAAFAAYSASYLLCKRYGVDVSDYNFSRLPASFRESSPQQVRETLTEIRDTANQISTRMYRALEQNRASKAKEQER